MLRSIAKTVRGIREVSRKQRKEKLRWEGFAEKGVLSLE